MALPRLRAELSDGRVAARVLRGALRHEVEVVPLSYPPASAGQHLLEVAIPGRQSVVLLANPAGDPTDEGQPLHVRPITREQMATLLDLVERLDEEPSKSVPPEEDPPDPTASDDADEGSDETVVTPMTFEDALGPAALPAFGAIDSLVPPPSSSAPRLGSIAPGPPLIGRTIAGKYRIESLIGSGATAAVFRAMHADLKRGVAVKILHEQNRDDVQFVKRFKAEALAASKLEHRNVARVLDFGIEADGMLYIVMELLGGRSLEAILAAEGRLASRVVARIGVQACAALAAAHEEGIIHRDVKPENIMLVPGRDDDGNECDVVKVCDFGLAKLRDADPEHADLTLGGMLCGSPVYMSPEQTRGEALDPRTDVYSLGVALYEALTGTLPHDAPTLGELFLDKATKEPRPPSQIASDVDPALEALVLDALASDRSQRPPTARAFRDQLRRVLSKLD